MERIHEVVGDTPSYVTFDIDVLDPAFACGTVSSIWCSHWTVCLTSLRLLCMLLAGYS